MYRVVFEVAERTITADGQRLLVPEIEVATNALMLSLGLVAYTLRRLCGQTPLAENDALPKGRKMPAAKPVSRRRLRSVTQDLMHFAARLTKHSSRMLFPPEEDRPGMSIL